MPNLAISVGALAFIVFFVLLGLFYSLLRLRVHSPAPRAADRAPPPSSSELLLANLSPFYAHGVLRAPTKFLLSTPELEAMFPLASPGATEVFVCISNPVYDEMNGGRGKRTIAGADPDEEPSIA